MGKYWEEERNATESGWQLTEELLEFNGNMSWWGEETVIATCYEDDLMDCANDLWADTSANIVVSECATEERMQSGSSAPVICRISHCCVVVGGCDWCWFLFLC